MLKELFCVTSVIVLCWLLIVCVWRKRKRKLAPGPKGYLCLGNSFQINVNTIHQDLHELHQEYGPVVRLSLHGTTVLSLSSVFAIHEAFEAFPVSECTNDRTKNSTADIYYGRKHIGCANLNNTTLQLRDFHKFYMFSIFKHGGHQQLQFQDEVKRFHLALISFPGGSISPHEQLKILHRNLCTIVLIGQSLSADDPDRDVLWEFIDLLYTLIDPSVDGALRMFPFLRHFPGYYGNLYRKVIEVRDKVGKRFYDDHKAGYQDGRVRGLVDICIQKQQEDMTKTGTSWLTDEYIKGLIFDTLVAGMTELMKTMRLFMLLMCHHPDVQAKLHVEIDSIIGTDRFPRAADRNWMPYTCAVMLEVWRYGSQTPLAIPHLCNKDVVVDGYLIESGSVIFPNLYAVHHDDDIWGDPWNFRPDRFLDKGGMLLPADNKLIQSVIPFSLGKRACPGQDFARSQTFISLTSLLQRVCILPPENGDLPSPDPRHHTKKYPLDEPDFKCRFVTRDNIVI